MRALPGTQHALQVLVAAGCTFASAAHAAPSARLVYLRNPGAESCPDEAMVRSAVAARLGYDPFLAHATATMFVELSKDAKAFRARVKLVDDQNLVRGTRELDAKGRCDELVDAMALSMSIAIDPDSLARAPAQPPPDPPRETPPPVEAPPPSASTPVAKPATPLARPLAPRTPGERVHLDASVGPAVWFLAAPAPNASGLLALAMRSRWASLGLEARYDLAASKTSKRAVVSTASVFGALAPCVHWRVLAGCVVWALGRIRAESANVTAPGADSNLHSVLGPSVRAALPVAGPLSLWARADALFALTPQHVQLSGSNVYALPAVSIGLAAGVGVRFF